MCTFILFLLPFFISVYGFEKRNGVSSDDIETILSSHNKYRTLHGSPALNWNNKLASYANQWSGKCIFDRSSVKYYTTLSFYICFLKYNHIDAVW